MAANQAVTAANQQMWGGVSSIASSIIGGIGSGGGAGGGGNWSGFGFRGGTGAFHRTSPSWMR